MGGYRNNVEGIGNLQAGTVANPGAGNQFSVPVPSGEIWEPLYIGYKYAPDGSGTDRFCQIQFTVSGVTPLITAGLRNGNNSTINYSWVRDSPTFYEEFAGGGPTTGSINVTHRLPFILLDGTNGDSMASLIQQFAAGDVLTNIEWYVRSWLC